MAAPGAPPPKQSGLNPSGYREISMTDDRKAPVTITPHVVSTAMKFMMLDGTPARSTRRVAQPQRRPTNCTAPNVRIRTSRSRERRSHSTASRASTSSSRGSGSDSDSSEPALAPAFSGGAR